MSDTADDATIVAYATAAVAAALEGSADPATISAAIAPTGLRERVMLALFARLLTVPGMATASRRMTLPGIVAPADQPCLMLWEQPEVARGATGLPDRRVWEAWAIVVFTNGDPTVAGSTIINPMLDAIEAALAIDDYGRNTCTLDGLVHYARIEGTIVKETGDTDVTGLGGAVVPIKIMPP